jgi:DNA-binding phage protein
MTKLGTTRFDAADYFDTEERQLAHVAAALESGAVELVRDAIGLVARARGQQKADGPVSRSSSDPF